ncbi:putative adenylyltransferase/sulfurtransferase MoeZ [mine drainage metagenome]|uniref:Putative adenylyltransferase/sulfurtransferase MoeZ n=1 Tax=mine drainage metagenome TaxID=410659 RepID=A0A1J5PV76_9ZZZZ
MMLVLALIAGLWGLGWLMKAPVRARLVMIGVLMAGVMLEQLLLPDGHPLRAATGGSAKVWLVLAGLLALILGYGALVRQLKARATPPATAPSGSFADAELDRYARHIMLREIGGPGQKALKSARVLVIGAGGLGSPVLLYLAAAGVGMIGVVDDDKVDASNLQRQVIHTDARIGMPKVFSAEAQMRALNPFITVRPYNRRLDDAAAREMFGDYDLILDGSDNFDTRYMVNRVAAETGKPLISAAITQWEGQISLYDPIHGSPCYECIFPTRPAPGLVPTCAEAGVVAPLPGVIGAMMALEAVKHLTGAGQTLAGEMLIYDGLWGETRKLQLTRRDDCPVCAGLGR